MKKISIILSVGILILLSAGCSDFLDRKSEAILSDDQIFSDPNMLTSVLANYYGRLTWPRANDQAPYRSQNLSNDEGREFARLDEACFSSGGPNNMQTFADDFWRIYDYELIRNVNQFLKGLKSDAAANLTPEYKSQVEGEARFIRAWVYFNMCRCLGGMPIVYDEVFDYQSGMDITPMQIPRSTEAGLYDYIIDECTAIAKILPDDPEKNKNAARGNKWAALTLKARAAIYAGSIAKYGYKTPDVKTSGGEVGIPASEASKYYQIAYDATQEIIAGGKYRLYTDNPDKGKNFYEAVCNKSSYEVIWAKDYKYPGQTTQFTAKNVATSVRGDIDANIITPILNLVEDFEYISNRNGALATTQANGDYSYYDNMSDIFKDKDPRLYGTVIYPGADFRGITVTYQAGQKYKEGSVWKNRTGVPGSYDDAGKLITDENGPTTSSADFVNKSGFNLRKFIDEYKDASTRGRGSEMWFVYMRYAEVLMIAAEASLELGKPQTEVCGFINQLRDRAGIQQLTTVNINDIVRESRVEFAFEDHRYWDLKRWRIAHEIWDGNSSTPTAVHYVLFPYRINQPGDPNDGKWVFDKQKASHTLNPRHFQYKNYYNFIDQDWLNKNPKMVRNPLQ